MTDPRDDLPDLDPAAAALLATYRRGRVMPPDAKARGLDRLSGTGARGHVLADRRFDRRSAAWAVALALAAAAVLWFGQRSAGLSERPGSAPTMSPAHGDAEPAGASPGVRPPAVPDVAPIAPLEVAAPAPIAPPGDVVMRDAPRANATGEARTKSARADEPVAELPHTDEVPAAPTVTSLRDEQELLARGWQALGDGRADDAARDAEAHAQRYPDGVLTPERRALAAAAACERDPDHGAALARSFLVDHPRSPLARRVRDACEVVP